MSAARILGGALAIALGLLTVISFLPLVNAVTVLAYWISGQVTHMEPAMITTLLFQQAGTFLVLLAATYWAPVAVRKFGAGKAA